MVSHICLIAIWSKGLRNAQQPQSKEVYCITEAFCWPQKASEGFRYPSGSDRSIYLASFGGQKGSMFDFLMDSCGFPWGCGSNNRSSLDSKTHLYSHVLRGRIWNKTKNNNCLLQFDGTLSLYVFFCLFVSITFPFLIAEFSWKNLSFSCDNSNLTY